MVAPTKEEIVQERENKLVKLLKKPTPWILFVLILLIVLGIYIRIQPMNINPNTGNPGLWDITTNTWTLGPDLDPWLFTRYAQTIAEGSLPEIDTMRNVPLGLPIPKGTNLLAYTIVFLHNFLNIFSETSVIFAAVIFPVVMFVFTIIAFFLFVREIFVRKSKESRTKSNIIALISTFFMIVIPSFLPRTIAGIPEKESIAFFFLFLSLYLFLKAWKSEKRYIIFAILAAISTACMTSIWGGVLYLFIPIAISSLVAFLLNKVHKKQLIIYSIWSVLTFALVLLFTQRYKFVQVFTSLDTGLMFIVLFIFIIHFILWHTKLKNLRILNTEKIPKTIISIIVAIILGILFSSIFFGPTFILSKLKDINHILFTPTTGRWNRTVAENSQPYFTSWARSFGPMLKNIPIMFWLFFVGSVVLFKKMLSNIKKKDSWILTGVYIIFFCGLVFSRYSSSGLFNGVNFISKAFYYGSLLLFASVFIFYYMRYFRAGDIGFEKTRFDYLLLFSLFSLCLITARSAVRLIMVLAVIAPIFIGYLILEYISKFREIKDDTWKVIFGFIIIIILVASVFTGWSFYKQSKGQAGAMIPSYYNQQWQKAMKWVREETPKDAVFAHWWDYGYWVQSIGNRATVTDGGNAISFWNYWTGRMVLTGDNQKDALDFLYTHEADYFLIDSSDIGKYTAFSSIGSDENYDRYSWIGTFLMDESQIKETKNETIYFYSGGVNLDEDIMIMDNGKETLLPRMNAGVGAILITTDEQEKPTSASIIAVYQGKQRIIDIRYISINGELIDFGSGIESTILLYPRLTQDSQGLKQHPFGAAMFISPRLMRGMLAQVYILNDPFDNFNAFELAHTEPNFIINDLRNQGMPLPDFIYFNGVQGPIKIWKIKYTGEEEFKQKYLDKDASKYLSWSL